MTNKKIYWIVAIVALMMGYSIGAIFSDKTPKGGNAYGDEAVDPELEMAAQRLKSDADFKQQNLSSIALLKERMNTLLELSNMTVEACAEVAELKEEIKPVYSLLAKAHNTGLALEAVSKAVTKMADGKKAPEFNQVSSDAYMGICKVENQLGTIKDFVEKAKAYLQEQSNDMLPTLVEKWARFLAQDAIMSGDGENFDYWKGKMKEPSTLGMLFSDQLMAYNQLKLQPELMDAHIDLFEANVFKAGETENVNPELGEAYQESMIVYGNLIQCVIFDTYLQQDNLTVEEAQDSIAVE